MPAENPQAFTKTFSQTGTFRALYAAQDWLRENGYSYGSTCREMPIGLMKGDYCIAKWKNLTQEGIAALDGVMQGSLREGPIEIRLKQALA